MDTDQGLETSHSLNITRVINNIQLTIKVIKYDNKFKNKCINFIYILLYKHK